MKIIIERTEYKDPGPQKWLVECDEPASLSYHNDLELALVVARGFMHVRELKEQAK